ncbi:MAG: glycine zipper 2TM domain-containing protein [Rhodanobacter sp.]|uniref:glycine zipper 2TM domain-containing protein n=1 Tax=Rhodanobacter sp. KK11 TaxID=3083255 RepID=UPI0029675DF2|nr:glycine zipper 2TM domain-containing protein [Rhodanobacter sp. KK11]MDW2982510.1 glycine zipper 2TM domain-containing protein [Rhodanobacter sp. KK11]
MNALTSKFALATAMAAGLALAGCATSPYGNNRGYDRGYQGQQSGYGYGSRNARCQTCGVVQEVQQVYLDGGSGNGGTLGAIIGAVAGGVLGNQVGKGDGRKAATVAGAVAGGVVGNQIGKRNSGSDVAWRIVVRLDNGQYATVTQRDNPGVRSGDYVEVRGDQVYPR